MKKVILLLTLLLGLILVSCQKDEVKQAVISPSIPTTSGSGIVPDNPVVTEGGIKPEEPSKAPIFTQEERDYVNNTLNALTNCTIPKRNITDQEIYFEIVSKCGPNNVKLIVDIKKLNSIYIKNEKEYNNGRFMRESTNYDITIPRFFGEQPESDYFDLAAYNKYSEFLRNNPIKTTVFWYDCELASNSPSIYEGKDSYLKLRIWKTTSTTPEIVHEEISDFYIFLANNKFIIADASGKIAEENSFENIINNPVVIEKINKVIDANK